MAYSCVRINFEIGHEASIRNKPTPEGFTHDWEVFVRGVDNADIHHCIEKVVFHLHDTFPKPKRTFKEPPYCVKETGYAGFNLPIDIYFKSKDENRKARFYYDLTLQKSGPRISKIIKEKTDFTNPSEDFRRKLIKSGGVGIGSDGSCLALDKGPNSTANSSGNSLTVNSTNEEKKSSPSSIKSKSNAPEQTKKHKVKDPQKLDDGKASNAFAALFGTPIKTAKVSSPTSTKPSSSSTSSSLLNKSVPLESRSNHEKSSKETKPSKPSPQKDKEKESQLKKEKDSDKNLIKDKIKAHHKDNKEKDRLKEKAKRSASPSPIPPPKPQVKEELRKLVDEKNSMKVDSIKPEKKHKDKKSRDEKDKKEKHKDHHEKRKTEEQQQQQQQLPEKEKKEKKELIKDSPKEMPKVIPKEDKKVEEKKEKKKENDKPEKPRHKHKKKDKYKDEEKDKMRKKEEKEVTKLKIKSLPNSPLVLPPLSPEPVTKSGHPLKTLIQELPDKDSDSDFSVNEEDIKRDLDVLPKFEPEERKPDPKEETKTKKHKKHKDEDKEIKKRKRKSKEKEEPLEKIRLIEEKEEPKIDMDVDDSMSSRSPSPDTLFTDDYVSQLKQLQHKIMTLQDNADLQRVVQVISETGQFEITQRTFDFDLCALDPSTVKRLQDMFVGAS